MSITLKPTKGAGYERRSTRAVLLLLCCELVCYEQLDHGRLGIVAVCHVFQSIHADTHSLGTPSKFLEPQELEFCSQVHFAGTSTRQLVCYEQLDHSRLGIIVLHIAVCHVLKQCTVDTALSCSLPQLLET